MFKTLRNALKIKDIRTKLLYTFVCLIIIRIGCQLPVPGINRTYFAYWLATQTGVSVGSDAFFPFGDNVERARKSGVCYIAQPGGSVRDDNVIETANKYDIAMCFTGARLFHH